MTRLSGFEQLSGDDWQDLCLRILHEHHPGTELQPVPDDDRGDAGLEAFSLNGRAYQCYAPEGEPLSLDERFRKQRSKVTSDIGKFINNVDKIKAMIPDGLLIERWVLLVPFVNTRRVLEHAKAQTSRVREANLPYAADGVTVTVRTLDAYEAARTAVISRQVSKLQLPPVEGSEYSGLDDKLIGTMDGKLAMTSAYSDQIRRSSMVDRLLANHVTGLAHRSHVSDYYSELGDRLEIELGDLEQRLAMQYALSEPVPDRRLITVLDATESAVEKVLNTTSSHSRIIAEGQVADWLMRCPLDFQ